MTLSSNKVISSNGNGSSVSRLFRSFPINFNPESITASSWSNSGDGPDLDTVVGTGANLSVGSFGGFNALVTTGSAGLESGVGFSLSVPYTIFCVAKFDNASPSGSQVLLHARSSSTDRSIIFSNAANSNKFSMLDDNTVGLTEPYDTDWHLFTLENNGDATSRLTVSGVGFATGDIGSDPWDFGSILISSGGGASGPSRMTDLKAASDLTQSQIARANNYLMNKYGL